MIKLQLVIPSKIPSLPSMHDKKREIKFVEAWMSELL
jgi:hypothetical protein